MLLEEQFKALGFSKNEISIYLALAETGKATAQLLSRRARMPRTTAYFVLDNLVKRGLVTQEKKRGTTFFTANRPSVLVRLVKEEKDEAIRKEALAKTLADTLEPYFKSHLFHVPTIQFFEGKENVEGMLYDYCAEWSQSIQSYDNIWWGYQDHHFVLEYRKWLEDYWKVMGEQKVQLFSNESDIEKQLKVPGRTIRPVPKSFEFRSTIWVCGDYLVVLQHRHKPQYAFQIKDATLAGNLKVILQLLWSMKF